MIFSSASVCLLALSLFISILPPILCSTCLLAPSCTAATLLSQSPHLLSSVSPYAFSFSWELSIEMSCLCVCPSIFLSFCVWAKRPSPPRWQPLSLWLYFGHGALTETLEGLSGKRHWGETERALKRLWIPVRSPVLTGSSSLLACSQRLRWMGGIVGMDGSQLERQLWAATLAKKHQQGINLVMKELERQHEHEHAYVCVWLHICVYLYLYRRGVCVWGVVVKPEKMWLVKHCRKQGRLCLEIPAYMCQHYGCEVCKGRE